MKIIAGLGNPGTKYDGTRHNVGFDAIDILADRHGIRVNTNRQKGLVGTGLIAGEKVLLVKPQTYMNNSGECLGPIASYYRVDPEDIIVLCDEIALDVGRIRVRGKGSAGGHNGMKSIISHLGSTEYPRIRIGVGAKPARMDLADHVLGHFPAAERSVIREAEEMAADAVESLLKDGLDRTMNRFNAAKKEAAGE